MVLIMRSDNMKEYKSTDILLNTIYEEYMSDISKYDLPYVCGILTGAMIYSYTIDNISHSEFTELLHVIRDIVK